MDIEREIREHSDALAQIVGSNVAVILICRRSPGGGYVWRAKVKIGAKALTQTNWYPSPDGALRGLGTDGTRLAASRGESAGGPAEVGGETWRRR